MLETLLGSLLGGSARDKAETPGQTEENGLAKWIPIIVLFFIVAGGLKLFKAKEEEEVN